MYTTFNFDTTLLPYLSTYLKLSHSMSDFLHIKYMFDFSCISKVWNLPSYSVEGEVEEKTKFPKDSIGPPIINCTEPLAINVKPATQYRGPPDMRVRQHKITMYHF